MKLHSLNIEIPLTEIYRRIAGIQEKQRFRSPTFFVNLQMVFASAEKVGDLGLGLRVQIPDFFCKFANCLQLAQKKSGILATCSEMPLVTGNKSAGILIMSQKWHCNESFILDCNRYLLHVKSLCEREETKHHPRSTPFSILQYKGKLAGRALLAFLVSPINSV